ncbi:MAG TPA: TfoX/Sxy family protein [Gemmatimonadales bacterium]
MASSAGFRDFVLDQLSRAGLRVRARPMFGGFGIYAGDRFFALIAGDTLYFKVDDSNRPDFEALDMKPFQPYGEGSEAMKYYQVPADLLDEPDALRPWAEKSLAVAARKPVARKAKKKKKKK